MAFKISNLGTMNTEAFYHAYSYVGDFGDLTGSKTTESGQHAFSHTHTLKIKFSLIQWSRHSKNLCRKYGRTDWAFRISLNGDKEKKNDLI